MSIFGNLAKALMPHHHDNREEKPRVDPRVNDALVAVVVAADALQKATDRERRVAELLGDAVRNGAAAEEGHH